MIEENIKHYVDENGNYLGVFVDGAVPDVEATEVTPRPDDHHVWQDEEWVYSEDAHWEAIRRDRNNLLEQTDAKAGATDHPKHQELLDYRQALRDLPQTFTNPRDVVWPDNPIEGV